MLQLVRIELYKLRKKNILYILFICNLLPVLYGLGAKFEWSFIQISTKLDWINFATTMWTLTFIFAIPLIMFMYLGASMIGGEKYNGQIMLAVTRVADRSKLISGKFLALSLLVLGFYVFNLCVSILSHLLFIRGTQYSQPAVWNEDTLSGILTSLGTTAFILLLCYIVMLSSVKYSALIATVVGLLCYLLSQVLQYIPSIKKFSPAYFVLTERSDLDDLGLLLCYQIVLYLVLYVLIMRITKKIFKTIDL